MATRMKTVNLEEFNQNTTTWKIYFQRFLMYSKINQLSEVDQIVHLLYAIGTGPLVILTAISSPILPGKQPIQEINRLMERHIGECANVIAERHRFWNMRQETNEKISEFLVRIKIAAIRCSFGEFQYEACEIV
ncbi:hypothetical protein HZS_6624 [Henneguya salminicola]|nr:hypothetical protein HZS_6624 [Henneguya salminicola]